jgi:hypothetical protein
MKVTYFQSVDSVSGFIECVHEMHGLVAVLGEVTEYSGRLWARREKLLIVL